MNRLVKQLGAASAALLLYSTGANSQDTTTKSPTACATVLTPSYSPPVVAEGWKAQLVATGLSSPRSLKFDTNGGLLVVEAGVGIKHLTFTDGGGTCLSVQSTKTLVGKGDAPDPTKFNHGIELSEDGKTLYASTVEDVYRWNYDPDAVSVTDRQVVIQNMTNPNGGHVSRTLLLSRKQPGLLLVSRGSGENMDDLASQQSSGVSQIRAFNISSLTSTSRAYDYPSSGLLIGWGLRNSVGVAEHPTTGGIFSVENSADNLNRLGVDIHADNPGEELNYHGTLPTPLSSNHGYPSCFALWNTTSFPSLNNLTVGAQFSLHPDDTSSITDTTCATDFTPPVLTFTSHMAPLDLKFPPSSSSSPPTMAIITFHGSWNRPSPQGYKLASVAFSPSTNQPASAPDSTTAVSDILSAPDVSVCGGSGKKCFRPVGMAFDAGGGRLFVSSDATGEIWVVMRTTAAEAGGTGTVGGGGAASTSTAGAAAVKVGGYRGWGGEAWVMVLVTVVGVVVGGVGLVVV